MSQQQTENGQRNWTSWEKIAFRFFFIYFLLQVVPLNRTFYSDLFSIQWGHLYGDLFNLAHYQPRFFSAYPGFADWGLIALAAALGTAIWTRLDKNTADYRRLNYWLRVVLRYRLAIAVIAYGLISAFPLLAPYPSISNLNTHYGDYSRWKLFSLSLGIVPGYESFLGWVEIVSGFLLLFRKTVPVGSLFISIFLGNVLASNIAYGGGEVVYSLFLITIALFLLSYDIQRIFNLLVLQKPTEPNRYQPVFSRKWEKYLLSGSKAFFVLVVIFYGLSAKAGYREDPYQFPHAKGISGISGIYNVTQFRINGDSIPFSADDPVRWKDVVFEEWPTISIRSNRPVVPDTNNQERFRLGNEERKYELEGTGGRHYYSYVYDETQKTLTLQNRSKNYPREKWVLHYERPGNSEIILSGVNENKDSVWVVLDRIDKKYLLQEVERRGRQKPFSL